MSLGLDYYGKVSKEYLNKFKSAGISFICRYYCPIGYSNKLMTKKEAQEISNAGMDVVAVYEAGGSKPRHFTHSNGYNDCMEAVSRAQAIGQPYNSAIYFAVDTDMRNNLSAVYDYFHGVSDAMMEYYHRNGDKWYTGIYGGYDVIKYMNNKWGVTHLWQAKAWEYGQGVYSQANMHQYENEVENFCGLPKPQNVDKDRSYKSIGGFRIS